MKKAMYGWGMVGILALAGCQSGMYSSEVSVEKNDTGVSDYTIVKSLDVEEFPQSMPVVVESTSKYERGEHGLNNLLWFFTLGIVPGIFSEAAIYDVTVKSPLGEMSGTCKVEASSWVGWLPIFIPYPGTAEERTANPRLPNQPLESKVRDQLVANLVSQFSKNQYAAARVSLNKEVAERKLKEEYSAWQNSDDGVASVPLDVFVSKYQNGWRERAAAKKAQRLEFEEWKSSDDVVANVSLEEFVSKHQNGWRERAEAKKNARLANEDAERAEKMRLAKRTALYEETVANDLETIKKCYSKGDRYENPFLGDRQRYRNEKSDWLSKWASSRLDLTEADALAGEALLSEFGTKYLPNAYARYEKKRDAVAELQQVFNEEFPQPWTIKSTDPKWNSFNKVLEKFVEARTEYFICHDELCHYWLLNRFGVLADKDFALIDAKPLAVHLLPENAERAGYTLLKMNSMESKIADFAVKYAPESNEIYQKMGREFKEIDALLLEVSEQHIQMDDVRYSRVLTAAIAKRNDLVREMNALSLQLQAWYMDHKTTEKSSEDVAKCDSVMSKRLKPFMDALPSYIKDHALGPIVANSDLIEIPGRCYRMQRTEVTQLQWMAVMGNNPSMWCGPDRPVERVSWNDCQEFIKRASQMDGREYRLPREGEWEFACRAGSTTDWGRRVNGECGPLEAMGWNLGSGTHAVALKEPNAWGLFDMHGNVWEWCADQAAYGRRVIRGGSYYDDADDCTSSYRDSHDPSYYNGYGGFRLACWL